MSPKVFGSNRILSYFRVHIFSNIPSDISLHFCPLQHHKYGFKYPPPPQKKVLFFKCMFMCKTTNLNLIKTCIHSIKSGKRVYTSTRLYLYYLKTATKENKAIIWYAICHCFSCSTLESEVLISLWHSPLIPCHSISQHQSKEEMKRKWKFIQ